MINRYLNDDNFDRLRKDFQFLTKIVNSFIIASKTSFAVEILESYPNAYLFDYFDYVALGEYMIDIIESKVHPKGYSKTVNEESSLNRVVESIALNLKEWDLKHENIMVNKYTVSL